jgi:hypothetical protein
VWDRIKKLFKGEPPASPPSPPPANAAFKGARRAADPARAPEKVGFQAPRPDLADKEPSWIEAADNPFGVRILDVRPVTLGTLSMSRDPKMAANAVSYGGEVGSSFSAASPAGARRVEASLRYRAPEHLVDGALFIPGEMEDKWALFIQARTLLLVRSWRREVVLRAALRVEGDAILVGPLEGFVSAEDEPEDYTRRAVDFILRTHALRAPWPAPLVGTDAAEPRALALQTMSMFGRSAHCATFDEPTHGPPERPLRVVHRLHMAVIRGDLDAAREALAQGTPVDLRDGFGHCPVHYVKEAGPLLALLRAAGAQLDARADEGDTLLMLAAQERRRALVDALLEQGADAAAVDGRGFSALHRAAEMGEVEIAGALLARGADPDLAAEGGHSPRSLATARGEAAILALFPGAPPR